MNRISSNIIKTGRSKLVFILSIAVSVFLSLSKLINVYKISFVGAVFEILWLPMICLLALLPIISMVALAKEKFIVRSLYFFSILILAVTILFITFYK